MPDANGWPTERECIDLLDLTAPDPLTAQLLKQVAPIRAGIIADFQAPVGPKQTGGTGRSFAPIIETRTFDGNGRCELAVHDLRPPVTQTDGTIVNPVTVNIYAYSLTDVGVRQAQPNAQHNILFRRQYAASGVPFTDYTYVTAPHAYAATAPYPQRVFPAGLQNVSVTATWGAVVTPDIYEAVRGEVCYQALVAGVMGLNGVGEDISIGDFELNTSVGAINFKTTSPMTVFHDKYVNIKNTYRLRVPKRMVQYAQKMI